MARINVDSSALNDPRFKIMGMLVGGNKFTALGMMAHVWNYCTENSLYEIDEKILVAITEVKNIADAMIQSELGERKENKIRVCGTKGRIEWLETLRKNGRKGARARKGKKNPKGNPKATQMDTQKDRQMDKQNQSRTNPELTPLSPALAPSPDISPAPTKKNIKRKPRQTSLTEKDSGMATHKFIQVYCDAFKKSKGSSPPILKKDAGIASRIVKEIGMKRSLELIEGYFEMKEGWFHKKAHDLVTFEQNI